MSIGNIPVGDYKQISTSGNVRASDGVLLGIFVSSASNTPTITVYDDVATGTATKIADTFTPTVGWWNIPVTFKNGCNVVISGTVSCTVVTVPG